MGKTRQNGKFGRADMLRFLKSSSTARPRSSLPVPARVVADGTRTSAWASVPPLLPLRASTSVRFHDKSAKETNVPSYQLESFLDRPPAFVAKSEPTRRRHATLRNTESEDRQPATHTRQQAPAHESKRAVDGKEEGDMTERQNEGREGGTNG